MAIIILLNLLFYYLARKNKIFKNKKTRIILFVSFAIEILLLVIYRVNLSLIGREVYFSDAETYWNNTMELIETGHSSGYNSVYYYICAAIQKTSPIIWAGWNNIFNITCLNLSVLLSLIYIAKKDFSETNKRLFITFTMMNPFIVYGLMRNLKDALFMLMAFFTFFITSKFFETKRKIIKLLILLILVYLAYLFTSIRPWAFIIPTISILYIAQKQIRQKFKIKGRHLAIIFLVISLIGAAIIFLVPSIYNNIKIWAPIVFESATGRNILSNILGVGKFILAPGPVRAFMGSQFFEHYTISGNIMAGIGGIIWWISLIYMIYFVLAQKIKKISLKDNNAFWILLALTAILFTIIYTLQYGGTAELRIKSILYIFVYSLFFQFYDVGKNPHNKKIAIVTATVMSIIFILISILSIIE